MRLFLSCATFFALLLLPLTGHGEPSSHRTSVGRADPPFLLPPSLEVMKLRSARLITSKGTIWFDLYPEDAPWHVANFKYLADKGFYRNKQFHLFQSGYVIQGGAAPTASGTLPYSLPPEFSRRHHEEGTLGMARYHQGGNNPYRVSNSTQFHILLGDAPQMDGLYTIFGKVSKGLSVLRNLSKGDTIVDLQVFVRPSGSSRD